MRLYFIEKNTKEGPATLTWKVATGKRNNKKVSWRIKGFLRCRQMLKELRKENPNDKYRMGYKKTVRGNWKFSIFNTLKFTR